jgi:hypothetical protein
MLMRAFMYVLLIDSDSLQVLTVSDILVLGLVLNISIFNERAGVFNYNPRISSVSSTISIALIVIFSLLFFCELVNEAKLTFKPRSLLLVGGFFSIVTLIACIVYIVNSNPLREKEK